MNDTPESPRPASRSRLALAALIGTGLVAVLALLGAVYWAVPQPQAAADGSPQTPAVAADEANTAEADTTEADARAEWQARQARITQVMGTKDRATLIGNSPTQGPADADIILFKFSDFQCPYCAIAAGEMKEFTGRHGEDVLYVYKNLPLTAIHDQAMPAARAAWAAQQQGQFWLYHDALFVHQDQLGEDLYVELAKLLELDVEQFNRDRTSAASLAAVQQDLALAQELGLNSTPTFLMNDFLIPPGAPLEFFEDLRGRFQALIDSRQE